MATFVANGKSLQPDEPTSQIYDHVFGDAYKQCSYKILNRAQYINSVQKQPEEKSNFCDELMTELHYSATGIHMPVLEGLYADWEWLIVVSNVTKSPLVMGAIGYERQGDSNYVSFLYIRNAYQGMGLGSKLLGIVEKNTKDKVVLLPDSSSAESWYKKRGYSECHEMDMAWSKKIND